jgi:transposase-like protein
MKRQKKQVFTEEFKYKVALEYIETDISQLNLMDKYSIRGGNCISKWVCKFGLSSGLSEDLNSGSKRNTMKKGREKTNEEKSLERKVQDLEDQLKYERLRTDALDRLIKIAEDKFKIAIRKKYGTKQ